MHSDSLKWYTFRESRGACAPERIKMAISARIEAEAKRTIDGIRRFYEQYGDEYCDSAEREFRIARIEAAKEGCNGLTQEEKIQKTAENVFEFACAQERTYDALRLEIKKSGDTFSEKLNQGLDKIKSEMQAGFKEISSKIEESCFDQPDRKRARRRIPVWSRVTDLICGHPDMTFLTIIIILILSFVSGNFKIVDMCKSLTPMQQVQQCQQPTTQE